MMSHMSAMCAHGVTFQSITMPIMYDYCAVAIWDVNDISLKHLISV